MLAKLPNTDQLDKLKNYMKVLEQYEIDKQNTTEAMREVYDDAKEDGLNPKAMKAILRLRRQDPNEREEMEAVVDAYLVALENSNVA